MTVVEIIPPKKKRRSKQPPLVPLHKVSGAGRFYERTLRKIITDLGGEEETTTQEFQLAEAFAGHAATKRILLFELLSGEFTVAELTALSNSLSQNSSTMLRITDRLGLDPREFDTEPTTMEEFLAQRELNKNKKANNDEDSEDK